MTPLPKPNDDSPVCAEVGACGAFVVRGAVQLDLPLIVPCGPWVHATAEAWDIAEVIASERRRRA